MPKQAPSYWQPPCWFDDNNVSQNHMWNVYLVLPLKYTDNVCSSRQKQCFILEIVTWQPSSLCQSITAPATRKLRMTMMTSSNGNIFRVAGPLCGEFTGPGEFPAQRPVTRSFDVFFDLRLNKRLSKQSWGWWFETPAWSLWRHRNGYQTVGSLSLPAILNDFTVFSINSLYPGRYGWKCPIQTLLYYDRFLWNHSPLNATKRHWW